MPGPINFIEGGTVTSAQGFSAGATYAGLKTFAEDKLDLGLIISETLCVAAGVFTSSTIKSPTVTVNRGHLAQSPSRGIVVNAGIANACVGEQGNKDAREMANLAAQKISSRPDEILVCSTGVIGVELPMSLIREGLTKIELTSNGGHEVARAMMTTDTRTKEAAVSFEIDGRAVHLGGVAKGSGMIHPNMATMLAFMSTDANVDQEFLSATLSEAVDVSFNLVSVDTDQSTNDTCILMANGAAGNAEIATGTPDGELFAAAVMDVAVHLAREMARDGEGATKLIDSTVTGAHTVEDAQVAARSIVASPLVKTAVYGRDPNWGRILMALGKTSIPLDESKIQVFINDIQIVEGGAAIPYHVESVVQALGRSEVYLRVALNVGEGDATAWGCDLTEEYVVFNSAYTT